MHEQSIKDVQFDLESIVTPNLAIAYRNPQQLVVDIYTVCK